MTDRISESDFITGLLAGIASHKVHRIAMTDKFYPAVVEAFNHFSALAEPHDTKLTFYFILDKLHGDSLGVKNAISAAIGRGILTPTENGLQIDISESYAPNYLESVPGDNKWYKEAAKVFLTNI